MIARTPLVHLAAALLLCVIGVTAASAAAPALGPRPVLVILAQFSDKFGITTTADWQARFFASTNSVKHYYQVASYNLMTLTPAFESFGAINSPGVNDGIVGWVTLSTPHPNPGSSIGTANQQITKDAIVAANPYVNFATYDANADGRVSPSELLVVVIVAGGDASYDSCSPSVWRHNGSIASIAPPVVDGVTVGADGYAQAGEMHCSASSAGHQSTIGPIAHEIGRLLGLPELYDSDGTSEGVGRWSLMGAGFWNGVADLGDSPALLDPWSKAQLGWVTPTLVSGTLTTQTIPAAVTSSTVYQFRSGTAGASSSEYFLLENRQQTGYDAALPGSGLLMWHIDEAQPSNRNECIPGGSPACSSSNHYKVALVQADNAFDLERRVDRGDAGDPFPGSTNNQAWNDSTVPNSRLWSGTTSNVSVTNISASSSTMTATLTADCTAPVAIGSIVSGTLTLGSCASLNNPSRRANRFTFNGTQGQSVNITMQSEAVDAFLYLMNSSGTVIRQDDDGCAGSGYWDSCISNFVLPTTGTYTIEATYVDSSGHGAYTMTLTVPGGGLTVEPAGTLDFGTVIFGQVGDRNFIVSNTGTGTLVGAAVVGCQTHIGDASCRTPFSVIAGGNYVLAPGASQVVTVRFNPTFKLIDNRKVGFSGNGNFVIRVASGAAGEFTVTPASQDFGVVAVGQIVDRTFSVSNTGSGEITGTASVSAPFSIVGSANYTLASGAPPQSVTVRYTPTVGGSPSSTVNFTNGGPLVTRPVTAKTGPTVLTMPATPFTATGATLRGTVNPHGTSTTASFEYGPTTAYGTSVPATPLPGSGTVAVSVSAVIGGLTCNTLYHFRAVATNGTPISGLDVTFTTAACPPPTVVTLDATPPTATGATLNGTVNPNGSSTTASFQYGLTVAYGMSVPASPVPGSGLSAVTVSAPISGLVCNTTYHFRAVGTNASTAVGDDKAFTTTACPPTAVTQPASSMTPTGATLNGTANPNGSSTTAAFEYGLTTTYGTSVSGTPVPGSGLSPVPVTAAITGLTCNTPYHFRARATNAGGTTFGEDLTFMTAACLPPTVVTLPASNITTTGATLGGTVNPNGSSTTASFEYGPTETYGTPAPAAPVPGSGLLAVPVSGSISGLACNSTYHFRARATNSNPVPSVGGDLTFKTAACLPVVTLAATDITATGATLNAEVNPNGTTMVLAFEYAIGTIGNNASFLFYRGEIGSGTTTVRASQELAGLVCETTYQYRAFVQNSSGAVIPPKGDNQSFTTKSCPGAPFTDDVLTARTSGIRVVHITELRDRIDRLRRRFKLATFAWRDPALAAGMTMSVEHVNELRTALQDAYAEASRAAPIFADSPLGRGMIIRAVHIQQLRDAVRFLELN